MTTPPKTVLVLGAGASYGYGYPTGRQLGNRILSFHPEALHGWVPSFDPAATAEGFLADFRASLLPSIDRFVASRPEYAHFAKIAIAQVLLNCESEAALYDPTKEDSWYRYLVDKLLPVRWDDFDPSWLSIVTFNYDRSLEHALCRAVQATYRRSPEDAVQKLQSLQIHHVYGWLGAPWPMARDHIPYGSFRDAPQESRTQMLARAIAGLHLINDSRDRPETVDAIRACLEAAERVCFLGFSFDELNVKRLGAPQVFVRGNTIVETVATTIGMTDAEIMLTIYRLFRGGVATESQTLIDVPRFVRPGLGSHDGVRLEPEGSAGHFPFEPYRLRCEELLRESLFVG